MMKNKKGEFTWAQVAGLLLIVVVLYIVITGSGGFFNKLFAKVRGIEENVGKGLEGIDFGILNKEQEKKLCGDPQGFMNKLFTDAQKKRSDNDLNGAIVLFERYLGICNDKKENAKECSDKEFVELKNYCSRKSDAEAAIKLLKENRISELLIEFDSIKNTEFGRARQILEELKKLGENIDSRLVDLNKAEQEALSRTGSLGVQFENSACASRAPVEALKCEGDFQYNKGNYDKALFVYSKLANLVSSDSGIFDTYWQIGKVYERRGDKDKAYNLYEDLVVKYEGKNVLGYWEVKRKLNDVAKNSDYKGIVKFSKLQYDTLLQGSIDKNNDRDNWGWFSSSITKQGSVIPNSNRRSSLPNDGASINFVYDYFVDWSVRDQFKEQPFTRGDDDTDPYSSGFDCLDFSDYEYSSELTGGGPTKGITLKVDILDINWNYPVLCTKTENIKEVGYRRIEVCRLNNKPIYLDVTIVGCENRNQPVKGTLWVEGGLEPIRLDQYLVNK